MVNSKKATAVSINSAWVMRKKPSEQYCTAVESKWGWDRTLDLIAYMLIIAMMRRQTDEIC